LFCLDEAVLLVNDGIKSAASVPDALSRLARLLESVGSSADTNRLPSIAAQQALAGMINQSINRAVTCLYRELHTLTVSLTRRDRLSDEKKNTRQWFWYQLGPQEAQSHSWSSTGHGKWTAWVWEKKSGYELATVKRKRCQWGNIKLYRQSLLTTRILRMCANSNISKAVIWLKMKMWKWTSGQG